MLTANLTVLRASKAHRLWPHLRGPIHVAAILLIVAGTHWLTVKELSGLGARSDTHFAFVGPAFAFLVWSQRATLSGLPIRPFLPAMAGLVLCGALWLTGELVFMRILTDVAVVATIPFAVLAALGIHWLKALAFPLAFLLFAIPFWAPLVPTLVNWTASALYLGLSLSGVAVQREGAYFSISSGDWSVADACSGVGYLSASVMLGVLFSHMLFTGWRKRILFLIGVTALGVAGNWLRVYLTVVIAHLSDNRYLRDDHGSFGWVLYALLLIAIFRTGWKYRDQESVAAVDPTPRDRGDKPSRAAVFSAGVAATLAIVAWPAGLVAITQGEVEHTVRIADIAPQGSWRLAEYRDDRWTPTLHNPTSERMQSFHKDGRRVDVFIGVFQNQNWDSKLVSALNRTTDHANRRWVQSDRGSILIESGRKPFRADTATVVGQQNRELAWHWYWAGGTATASGMQAKALQLQALLLEGTDAGAWVSVSADAYPSGEAAATLLQGFMRDMGSALEQALLATTKR